MGKAFVLSAWLAASIAATVVLPPSASAQDTFSAGRAAPTKSSVIAGWEYANYVAIPESLSATMTVPRVRCRIPSESAIYAGIGVENEYNAAGLVIGCDNRTPYYWPSITLLGVPKNYPSDHAHPGDKIELSIGQSGSASTVSLIDVTHKFRVRQAGGGDATGNNLLVGEDAWDNPTPLPVPDFGTLRFSNARLSGSAFGSFGMSSNLAQFDRYSSTGQLEIATGPLSGNKQGFATVFKHS